MHNDCYYVSPLPKKLVLLTEDCDFGLLMCTMVVISQGCRKNFESGEAKKGHVIGRRNVHIEIITKKLQHQ